MSRHARIVIDDGSEPETVNAADAMRVQRRLQSTRPDLGFQQACVLCTQPLFVNDKKAGIKEAGYSNITGHWKSHFRRAGFSHYPGNNGVYCPGYKPNNPFFKAFGAEYEMDTREKQRNIAALNASGVREEINIMETFYLERLTGKKEISPEDRKIIDRAEQYLLSTKGLAENLWMLAVWAAISVGARTRNEGTWEYKLVGKKIGYVAEKELDGMRHPLRMRSDMELCWTPSDLLAEAHPLRRHWKPITFPATPEFAERIVADALDIHPADVKITAAIRAGAHREMLANETPEQKKIREARVELASLRTIPEDRRNLGVEALMARLSYFINPPPKPSKKSSIKRKQLDFFGS
jgi:hypothetical protein